MTKDDWDEWMRQRGCVALDELKAPRVSPRISPDELRRYHLWAERRKKVFFEILRDVLTKRITHEEGRRMLAETRMRDAEEFGMPCPAEEEKEGLNVTDSNSALGSAPDASTDEQVKVC